jgi:hypothetical protein
MSHTHNFWNSLTDFMLITCLTMDIMKGTKATSWTWLSSPMFFYTFRYLNRIPSHEVSQMFQWIHENLTWLEYNYHLLTVFSEEFLLRNILHSILNLFLLCPEYSSQNFITVTDPLSCLYQTVVKIRPKSLWRWYINTSIMFLDIIHRLVFNQKPSCLYSKHNVSESGFTWRWGQNPVSETLCFEYKQDGFWLKTRRCIMSKNIILVLMVEIIRLILYIYIYAELVNCLLKIQCKVS